MSDQKSAMMENKTETQTKSFVPPRHWVGLEELDAKYWEDPKILEKRGQEFFEKPIEYLEKLDKSEAGGLARRDFLTIMGASMAMATVACGRRPIHKIIPYVVNPEEVVPGVPLYYASVSKECVHGCGLLIKTREGRPIKLEGNPDHPVNRGKLCSQAQASVLNLYDTDRLKNPLVRDRSSGAAHDVSWDDADRAIVAKLKAAKSVRVLSGDLRSETTEKLISEFVSGFGNGRHVQYEPLALDEVAEAQELSYGAAVMPRYRFDQADVVVSLGSDFLGSGQDAVEAGKDWSKNRKVRSENASTAKMSKMYTFESAFTITGASADERYPVRPGDELKIALAIAHALGSTHEAIATYKPEAIEQEIGLEKGIIKKVAEDLSKNRGRGIVIAGSVNSKTKDALALQIAANHLNSLLGNEGSTIDGTVDVAAPVSSYAALEKLVGEMKSGAVDVLVIYRSNPVFTAPNSGFQDALGKVRFVVYVGDHDDETAKVSDYVLADHHYLENWGDSTTRKGVYTLQQPAISPIHNTRAFEDTLITWVKNGAGGGAMAKAAPDWHGYLQQNWKQTVYKQVGAVADFNLFWEGALRQGVVDLRESKGLFSTKASARGFKSGALSKLPKYSAVSNDLQLALYAHLTMMDGKFGNNPWLQELPEPISSATWDNYIAVAPETAKRLAVQNDDMVAVKSGDYSVELPVYVQPGLHPAVVVTAVGWGHRSIGKIGDGAGGDAYPFVKPEAGRLVFSGAPVSITKTQKFYKLATTQWHTVTENRPVLNDITLAQFRKNPATADETVPELRFKEPLTMWPLHIYKGYRWGMAVDLNSCTGCTACMIACQAENNIPVVGREQVRVSRQMHWIRIDRYYSGDKENPKIVFQPMLCQHCENAPCETVCPVLATVHDDEGLNVQVYNRCVGTRYCQNNCPYKVRRFNFFDQWKAYTGTMNMVWNPDVTVRTRGIMEKCTFCVQRIVEAKDKAKDKGELVADGDFQTACQQTCPTDAIVFGDINDPKSRVSKLHKEQHGFRALDSLNTRPALTYLSKVRNIEEASENG